MDTDFLVTGVLWFVVFLLSDTCHEAAHAWAAKLGGDLTAYHGGQVSLDPWPHIRREPFGMVVFPIISYALNGWMMGWASAPYDPLWADRHPRRAAWMSLAGPAADFVLAILAAILIHIGIWTGFFRYPDSVTLTQVVQGASTGIAGGAATFLSLLYTLNLIIGTFNLLPIPPLDGFGITGLFMSEDAARRFQAMGNSIRAYSFVGILLAWKLFDPLFNPLFDAFVKILYPTQSYGA